VDERAAGVIVQQAGTVSVPDATTDPGRAPERAGSFIGAPIYVAGEAAFVVGFAAGRIRQDYAAREVEIVEILAELVGHALTVEHAEAVVHRRSFELEQRNEELEQFAYVASHDLQEPLRTISSFLQLLEKRSADTIDEKGREYIAFALDGSRRMQTLIQGLLAYSRVGTRGAAFEPVDAEAVMDDVLVDLGPARLESHANIRVDELPTVCADPIQLHQLFLNLVGNALKFRAPEAAPSITVGAHRDQSTPGWRFTVADTGIGLDPRHGPRVFQLFQRLHTREEYEGTGIGLALCRKIVERHGGTIFYAPNEAGGTTFTFTLPDRGADCRGASLTPDADGRAG
jgi:light-regulated signal transduction histidine kinase (bacteriophytochrome)